MKHTPTTLRRLAERFGCTLDMERGGNTWQIILDAPPGKLLRESGCHCSAVIHGNGFHVGETDWNKTAADIENIASMGFEDCEDEDCDVCADEREDNQGSPL